MLWLFIRLLICFTSGTILAIISSLVQLPRSLKFDFDGISFGVSPQPHYLGPVVKTDANRNIRTHDYWVSR